MNKEENKLNQQQGRIGQLEIALKALVADIRGIEENSKEKGGAWRIQMKEYPKNSAGQADYYKKQVWKTQHDIKWTSLINAEALLKK